MRERIIHWLISITGIVCLFVFLSTRFLPMMNLILVEKMDTELQEFTKYGDLFYYNCINRFKVKFPNQIRRYRLSDKNPKMYNADILTFGDSFFDVSFQTTLPERITDTLNRKVYAYITQDPTQSNPFCILNIGGMHRSDTTKFLIFESVERNIPEKFSQPFNPECAGLRKANKDFKSKVLNEYIFKKSDEQLFDLILKRSYITSEIYSLISTLKFDLFDYISSLTPKYTFTPEPWLFYYRELDDKPGSSHYKYSSDEISTYADNIAKLSENLKSVYNLKLIFMAVPNKNSIYNIMVNNDKYCDFLPKLQEALVKRNVCYVDLYKNFVNSPDTLYFGTDTHWNKKGVDLALDLTLLSISGPVITDSIETFPITKCKN